MQSETGNGIYLPTVYSDDGRAGQSSFCLAKAIPSTSISASENGLTSCRRRFTTLPVQQVPKSSRNRSAPSRKTGLLRPARVTGLDLKSILLEANLTQPERRVVAALCAGPSSATDLLRPLGLNDKDVIVVNGLLGGAGHKVFDAAPQNSPIRKWYSEERRYYRVLATGRFESDKHYHWEIRPEVKQAFMELGWCSSPDYAPTADAGELEQRVSKLRKMSITTPPAGQEKPATVATTGQAYARDPLVKAWVLQNAQGKCEGCGSPAPFTGEDGEPFLESHHVRLLADGGSDKITNALALCPNCHRRCHLGADRKEFTESLYAKIPRLVRE